MVGMASDSDLTILLMLKDRAPFTFRWMSYANANNIRFPFKVFVADGGSDDTVQHVLSDRTRFPNVNYEYVRYPPDRSYADFYAKIENALSRIQTPFVALSDNDDFWVVNGLRESVQFLRTHPDYVTCGGQMAPFWVNASGRRDFRNSLYGSHVRWKCSRAPEPSTGATARERIRDECDVYYHVQRTAELRTRFRIVRDLSLRDLVLVECLLFLLTAIAGPSKTLDILYLARQNDSPGTSSAAHQEQYGGWFERMFLPSWSEDFTNIVNVVSTALAETDGIAPDEARAWVITWLRISIGQDVLMNLVEEPAFLALPTLMSLVVPALIARMPRDSIIRNVARHVYRRIHWVSDHAVRGTEWCSKPVSNADHDFKPIQEFLARGSEGKTSHGSTGETAVPAEMP